MLINTFPKLLIVACTMHACGNLLVNKNGAMKVVKLGENTAVTGKD